MERPPKAAADLDHTRRLVHVGGKTPHRFTWHDRKEVWVNRVVLTMKWGKAYAADYVNVLYGGVKAHLPGEFRFVCLTDDPTGIRPEVECMPIPDMGLPARGFTSGAWPKIAVFKPKHDGLTGRALFIDLDSMICGDLTAMFDQPGRLIMIHEWLRPIDRIKWNPPVRGASGVFAFTFDDLAEVHNSLAKDPNHWVATIQNDQRFMEHIIPNRAFWPETWVRSFKRHVLPGPGLNWFMKPGLPPAGCKVLAFHGRPRPAELVPDMGQRWGDFWRSGRGAVPWFRQYWLENGGRDGVIQEIGPR